MDGLEKNIKPTTLQTKSLDDNRPVGKLNPLFGDYIGKLSEMNPELEVKKVHKITPNQQPNPNQTQNQPLTPPPEAIEFKTTTTRNKPRSGSKENPLERTKGNPEYHQTPTNSNTNQQNHPGRNILNKNSTPQEPNTCNERSYYKPNWTKTYQPPNPSLSFVTKTTTDNKTSTKDK